jgi:predicted transcriptional regulator
MNINKMKIIASIVGIVVALTSRYLAGNQKSKIALDITRLDAETKINVAIINNNDVMERLIKKQS